MSDTVYADVLESATRWPRRRQKWFVRITAANHKVLFTSEMYTNRDDAVRTAKLVLQRAVAQQYGITKNMVADYESGRHTPNRVVRARIDTIIGGTP